MKINWKLLATMGILGALLSIVGKFITAIITGNNSAIVSIISFLGVVLVAVISIIFGLEKLYKLRPKWLTLAPEGYQFSTWFFIFFIVFNQVYFFRLFDAFKQRLEILNSQILIHALLLVIPFTFIHLLAVFAQKYTCVKISDSRQSE